MRNLETLSSDLFSRERLAGYDPSVLARSSVVVAGCGAVGNSVVQTLALVGLGEVRLVDPDVVEPSNLARSPLFARQPIEAKKKRWKAKELGEGFLRLSRAADPVARHALLPVESLGTGAFEGAAAIVSAVDSLEVRAYLSDQSRLLGIPLVEIGLSGLRGHVSVFANRSASEPCWRCAHPHVEGGTLSCTLSARRIAGRGLVPATQTIAAFVSALGTEHAIRAIHGDFPLGGTIVGVDLVTGRTRLIEVAADPACPGVHRRWDEIADVEAGSDNHADVVIEAASSLAADPILHLPTPYLAEAPCAKCGGTVHVGKPAWLVREAPACRSCPELPRLDKHPAVIVTSVSRGDRLGARRARDLGIAAGAILEVTDRATGKTTAIRIRGSAHDLFVTRRRERNATEVADMKEP